MSETENKVENKSAKKQEKAEKKMAKKAAKLEKKNSKKVALHDSTTAGVRILAFILVICMILPMAGTFIYYLINGGF